MHNLFPCKIEFVKMDFGGIKKKTTVFAANRNDAIVNIKKFKSTLDENTFEYQIHFRVMSKIPLIPDEHNQ